MEKNYHHLSATDRVTLMFLRRQGFSLRAIASELKRRRVKGRSYDAEIAEFAALPAWSLCRSRPKLIEGTDIHDVVIGMLRNKGSPQQISGVL